MAKGNQTILTVAALIVVGGVVLYLASNSSNTPTNEVEMKDVFTQTPLASAVQPVDMGKDPVPSPAIVTSPEHGKEAGFAVQVYSFKDHNRALAALENLKSNGFMNSYVEMSDLGPKGVWYRVRIGGLKDENQAKALLENVRKNFNSAILVKQSS